MVSKPHCKKHPKKTRKLLAEGLNLSRIFFLIPAWGGAPQKYLRQVQVIMNKSVRYVTNRGRMAGTRSLTPYLGECS